MANLVQAFQTRPRTNQNQNFVVGVRPTITDGSSLLSLVRRPLATQSTRKVAASVVKVWRASFHQDREPCVVYLDPLGTCPRPLVFLCAGGGCTNLVDWSEVFSAPMLIQSQVNSRRDRDPVQPTSIICGDWKTSSGSLLCATSFTRIGY